jgi:hypothetical protein
MVIEVVNVVKFVVFVVVEFVGDTEFLKDIGCISIA